MSTQNTEIFESLRMLHERVSRIELAGFLPTKWNPFSGASKSELDRITELENKIIQLNNAFIVQMSLIRNLQEDMKQIQTAPSAPPAYYPSPQLPTQPQYYPPASTPPYYSPPSAPPGP